MPTPEFSAPNPYPNKLPFMQDFATSPERPDANEMAHAAAAFGACVDELFLQDVREAWLEPDGSAVTWRVSVLGMNTRGTGMPSQAIELSAVDATGEEHDAYQYVLGADGVVRRIDMSEEGPEIDVDDAFAIKLGETTLALAASEAHEAFEEDMGVNEQPVSLAEVEALNAFITANRH